MYPTSELMPLPDTISLNISEPSPTKKVSLHAVSAEESTVKKTAVKCGCKDRKTWCSTGRCACYKGGVRCGIACHGPETECPNVQPMKSRTQQGHRSRTGVEGESKQRRRDIVGNIDVDESIE